MQNIFVECTINCSKALSVHINCILRSLWKHLKPSKSQRFSTICSLERCTKSFYMILPLADARWRHATWYPGVLCGASFVTDLHFLKMSMSICNRTQYNPCFTKSNIIHKYFASLKNGNISRQRHHRDLRESWYDCSPVVFLRQKDAILLTRSKQISPEPLNFLCIFLE